MGEINKVLGTFGSGVPCTIPVDGEIELEQEIEKMELQNPPPEQLLECKQRLAELKSLPHAVYTFYPLVKAKEGEWEEWLEQRAFEAVTKTKKKMESRARKLKLQATSEQDEDRKRELLKDASQLEREAAAKYNDLDDAITAGDYSFSSQISMRTMDSLEGLTKLVSLMLLEKVHEEEVEQLILNHQETILRAVKKANDLGKQQPPRLNGTTTVV